MPARPARTALVPAYGVTIRDKGHREHVSGQADLYDKPRARVVSWPPLRPTRLRRERGSVVVASPLLALTQIHVPSRYQSSRRTFENPSLSRKANARSEFGNPFYSRSAVCWSSKCERRLPPCIMISKSPECHNGADRLFFRFKIGARFPEAAQIPFPYLANKVAYGSRAIRTESQVFSAKPSSTEKFSDSQPRSSIRERPFSALFSSYHIAYALTPY